MPVDKAKWDLIAAVHMGRMIKFRAGALMQGLAFSGSLVVEHYRRDVARVSLSGGELGYPVNALLGTLVPSLSG